MKIVVTGGHLTPALAVILQLKKENPNLKFHFFGRRQAVEGDKADSFEYLEVKKNLIPFYDMPAGRIQRRITKYTLLSLSKILPGFLKSFYLLFKIKPQVVLTFGGYLSLPPAVAAFVLGIPIVAHEQSPKLGLANKIIFKLAKLKGVAEKSLKGKLSDREVILTGPLLREEIFKTASKNSELVNFLGKIGKSKLIFLTGGATGSHFLNQMVKPLIPKILEENFVIHQTGNLNDSSDLKRLNNLRLSLPKYYAKYFLKEFIATDDIGAILAAANLVICRSGANSTAELAAVGKVGILVPLEWGKEQKEIAQNFKKTGAFLVLNQNQLTSERLLAAINFIFKNYWEFRKNAKNLQKQIQTQGTTIFAKEILKILQNEQKS